MALNLSKAPQQYSADHMDQLQGNLEREDKKNLKASGVITSLKFRDTVTGTIVTLTVASGALVIT